MHEPGKTVFFGSDQKGYELKKDIQEFLKQKGYEVLDLGQFKNDEIPFEDIQNEVDEKVREHEGALGVLVMGKKEKEENTKDKK